MSKPLYIFLDEGGNFDFSPKGTRYFSLSCVTTTRQFAINSELESYKYDCIEYGLQQEYFHCTDDNNHVRNKVFAIIANNLDDIRIDSLLVEKKELHIALREPKHFYPFMLGSLISHIIKQNNIIEYNEIVVITDNLPQNKKREAIEKSIKMILSKVLIPVPYRIYHHASKSHYGLQIADYCNWAIFRKWERGDVSYYTKIQSSIYSEAVNRTRLIKMDNNIIKN